MITGKALLAGVTGWPISHSKSPILHGHWLHRHGIDGAYVPLAIAPENFKSAVLGLRDAGFRGLNVTLPHKEAAFDLATKRDAAAEAMGAVNTLIFHSDGTIEGRNTDGLGFLANLRAQAPEWDPTSGPALLWGAGGAARAITHALLEVGVPEVRLCNRTKSKAEALARDFPGAVVDDNLQGCTLAVNTTSLGMAGQPELSFDLSQLAPGGVVADIVYAPLETVLLAEARARGFTAVEGLGMLLHQAAPGFAAWFGTEPQVDDDLRRAVLGEG